MLLGVNIDHIAFLREARKINDPDPLEAVALVKRGGADQITIHLREDRRHINDDDARRIVKNSHLPVNMECSANPEIIEIICALKPYRATLVPERREEVTTEGGLDVIKNFDAITKAILKLKKAHIGVSLFIDPDFEAIAACADTKADAIELHTGSYANLYAMLYSNLSRTPHAIKSLDLSRSELQTLLDESIGSLQNAAIYASKSGLKVAAGHGLNYQNVKKIVQIKEIGELNIGQSIVARSIFVGLEQAVRQMRELMVS